MIRALTTFFFIGKLRPAPGTWGSAAAVAVALVLHGLGGFVLLAVATVLVTLLGFWSIARDLETRTEKDPSEIVIDEVAGQWLAMLAPSLGFTMAGLDSWNFPWPGWVAAFVLFRLFDIWKPWLVGWADRKGGAMGVMLDDLIAGVFAGIGVIVLAGLYHGVLAL
ncbi:phosphatidylglycerophosphatase A [Actibacterium atlanticum]|uniref:Phosphatidylglycerophosphatase A n=1 Tax=Actibacterium atlanticum TaxID=1461693 RepID=A0A058ZQA2_9RHOB|nr:phosphatidylglycerophosphatase A [Actibacterium atlanticum]KCV83734.1 phosphatidylglycerophosphatase A [Actibacterium atlanticum]